MLAVPESGECFSNYKKSKKRFSPISVGTGTLYHPITPKELLRIVSTLEHIHRYLLGQTFHLRTEYAVAWLLSLKNLDGQIACWVEWLF